MIILSENKSLTLSAEKDDFESKAHAKHLFAGQNTQHIFIEKCVAKFCDSLVSFLVF